MSGEFGMQNIAKDNAQVGVQGHVHGDVHMRDSGAQEQAGLHEQIDALRQELTRAYRDGSLDQETAAAAEEEITEAAAQAETDDEESRGRLVRALKRLKGLVEGAAGLTASVAVAISAAKGM